MDEKLLGLVVLCVPLSLLSFGGGQTIAVGLQHQTVDVYHWLTAQEFTTLFAISKTSPGPTTLIVALIGWHIAGLWGALVASLAMFLPSSLLVCLAGRYWERHRRSRWTAAIEQGLLPIAVGLMFAGSFAIARFAGFGPFDFAVIGVTLIVLWYTKIGPYPILGAVGLVYLGRSLAGFS